MDENSQFQKIQSICSGARLLYEGGQPVVYIPKATFKAVGKDVTMDLLLHPGEHSGYPTRLFFQEQIAGRGANWNHFDLLDKQWWSPSWNGVSPNLPWASILCEHLRGIA